MERRWFRRGGSSKDESGRIGFGVFAKGSRRNESGFRLVLGVGEIRVTSPEASYSEEVETDNGSCCIFVRQCVSRARARHVSPRILLSDTWARTLVFSSVGVW